MYYINYLYIYDDWGTWHTFTECIVISQTCENKQIKND